MVQPGDKTVGFHWVQKRSATTGVCYALELHETGSSWTLGPEIKEKEVEERFLEQG